MAYVVGSLLWAIGAVLIASAADPVTILAGGAVAVGALIVFVAAGFSRVSIAVLAAAAVVLAFVGGEPVLHQERSFFGVVSVLEVGDEHVLVHGTTVHGRQQFEPMPSPEPLAYYRSGSGIERLMASIPGVEREFAMVGLGAGSLAGWGRDGDVMRFYEIDQQVVDIAQDPALFTHLADTDADVDVEVVDGRIGLERSDGGFDLIVLDAFSSDSVPTHLLTLEAMRVYRDRLSPGGAIAVHVSNRYFDLAPVVGRIAIELGAEAWSFSNGSSVWVAVAERGGVSPAIAAELETWEPVDPSRASLWTDDYVNVLGTLRRS
jgi:spermidine synthase